MKFILYLIIDANLLLLIRLIVVAEKTVVYEKFPIPLINRLEKHILSMETMLTEEQMKLVKALQLWAEEFCSFNSCFIRGEGFAIFTHSFEKKIYFAIYCQMLDLKVTVIA